MAERFTRLVCVSYASAADILFIADLYIYRIWKHYFRFLLITRPHTLPISTRFLAMCIKCRSLDAAKLWWHSQQ